MTPKLRFPQFTENWQSLKLKDISEYSKTKILTKEIGSSTYAGVDNLKQGGGKTESNFLPASKSVTSYVEGDTLLSNIRPYLKKFLYATETGGASSDVLVVRPNIIKVNSLFLYINLTKDEFIEYVMTSAKGVKMPRGDKSHIMEYPIHLPLKTEQQKIAGFLSLVDERLSLTETKLDLLKKYKKGLMQKIFSQKLRFKDKNGKDYPEWEEKRLGELLLSFRLGGNYENTELITKNPLIKMGNLGRGNFNLKRIEYIPLEQEVYDSDRIRPGDLFFNTRNTLDLVGKVAIWRDELPLAYYNSNLMRLDFKCNLFMNYYLNSLPGLRSLKRLATGTTSVAAIYTRDLLKLKIKTAEDFEQRRIADFLSLVDDKISLEEKKLEQAKQYKKGLLQRMFV